MLITPQKKPLTGWLILFMVLLGLVSSSQIAKEITAVRQGFEPHFSDYPSLRSAVLAYQCLLLASACTALHTVWVLYQRIPGTLILAQRAYLITVVIRVMAPWVFHMLSDMPSGSLRPIQTNVSGSIILIVYSTIWYLYLAKSKRVEEIYAA